MKTRPYYLCPADRLCATATSIANAQHLQPEFDGECWHPLDAFHAGGPLDAPAFAPSGHTYKHQGSVDRNLALAGIVLLDGRLA